MKKMALERYAEAKNEFDEIEERVQTLCIDATPRPNININQKC